MKYIDTHCHLTSEYFDENQWKQEIKEAQKNGVSHILIPGTTEKDSKEILKYKSDNILVAPGVHPSEVFEGSSKFLKEIDLSNVSAIGEIGIDLYWESNPSLEIQIKEFEFQLDVALQKNLPVIIHMRNAEQETWDVLSQEKYKDLTIIMHSYTGSLEWAKKFLTLKSYISFSGIVTFKNAKEVQEVAKNVPLERILCETDSPYLTPTPHRGIKPNTPKQVKHVVEFIAQLRDEDNDKVVKQIYANTKALLKI